ncbi:MAG: tRNA-dihydrouridine synthase family protein [Bdellovibrionales bacterium]|nr:tRNA-dihydrouridine synthase family protein [Bdellovibrionales bacterium]
MIQPGKAALVLAPMEGVTDFPMRRFMTERGGFTHCVSEFIRVSQEIPPRKAFREFVPELAQGSQTAVGTPVQVQLLGGDPEKLAEAASLACSMGSPGVDLNFGCPAPTVNRHDGGATLLKYPLRIRAIVEAVRRSVPSHLPVSAKMRLGWDGVDAIFENASMAAEGGASWITIHARTRMAAYQPPVFWRQIGKVKQQLGTLPILANGDIWTLEDFVRCREESQCEHFMMGRGALANPDLVHAVARELGLPNDQSRTSTSLIRECWAPLLQRFIEISLDYFPVQSAVLARCKQWIRMAERNRGLNWFDEVKRIPTLQGLQEYFGLSEVSLGSREINP